MKKLNNIYLSFRYRLPLHFVLLFTNWLPDNVVFMKFRGWLASWFFKDCGKKLVLGRNLVFYNPDKISIGLNNYIAYGNVFIANIGINIKDNNLFGPSSVFVDGNHVFDGETFSNELGENAPIIIGSNCWIGAQTTILAGVNIADKVLVAAGSVLGVSPETETIYGGVPAKKIKDILSNKK
jgi:maltose O-acetyltransferase